MRMSLAISSTSASSPDVSLRWSTSLRTRQISSRSKVPLPSRSNRWKAWNKASRLEYSEWPKLTAVNSAKLSVPLASRSMASKISSAIASSSPYFLSAARISSTSRFPSPFLSRFEKAAWMMSNFSGLISSAMTRRVNFLKVLSDVFSITFWSTRIILPRFSRALLKQIHGWLSTRSAVSRIRHAFLRSPWTTSRASGILSQSFPKVMVDDLIASLRSGPFFPANGSLPVNIRNSKTPSAQQSVLWYALMLDLNDVKLGGMLSSSHTICGHV
mmetsp:Transcript_88284/g.270145  ORF Transcript_88284/g.270145 Transcript_88284/m.270145 type:complete len:272 (+) Transcript_88284:261-1076(+)